ncbi:MAG: hypothetical protein LVR00_04115 [Rhabdochlamydiaceae bacterium]|jgi:hypothetical protein
MAKIQFDWASDRIALLRNPTLRGAAELGLRVYRFIYSLLARGVYRVSSPLERAQQIFMSIPGYAQNVLFPAAPVFHEKPEKFESLLNRWIRNSLQTPLNSSQKEAIHEAIQGKLPIQQEEQLITDILAKKKEGLPSSDADDRRILTEFLQKAKAAAAKEKLGVPSPLQKIKNRALEEKGALSDLKKNLTFIDPTVIDRRIKESFRPDERAEFIRSRFPNIDPENLWDACSARNPEANLEEKIGYFQEGLNEEEKSPSEILLQFEYCLLLRARLVLSRSILAWETNDRYIDDLNNTASELFKTLRRAIEGRWDKTKAAINSPKAAILKIDAQLHAFKSLKKDPGLYFNHAKKLVEDIHQLEEEFLGTPCDFESYLNQTGAFSLRDAIRHIETVLDIPERRDLMGIKDPQEQKAKRHELLGEKLLYLCIRTTGDGQQLIRLMGPQPHCCSEEQLQLWQASRDFYHKLYTNNKDHLQNALFSIPEFVSHIERGKETITLSTLRNAHEEKYNISALAETLDLRMGPWHKALQQIWINHLPIQQEEQILATSRRKCEEKMSELFAQWMLEKTGIPFKCALSFNNLRLPDRERQRAEALRTIARKLPRRERPPAPPNTDASPFRGALLNSINLTPLMGGDSQIVFNATPFDVDGANQLAAPTDLITRIKNSPAYNPSAPLNDRIAWIVAASRNPIYLSGLKSGPLILYYAFFDTSKNLSNTSAPEELLNEFIDLVLREETLQSNNAWKKKFYPAIFE